MRFSFYFKMDFKVKNIFGGAKLRDFILGVIVGAVAGYFVYQNKDKIKDKLLEIELKVEKLELKENVKQKISEVINSLKQILKKTDDQPVEKQDEILKLVEDKIKQLEEIIQE